MVIKRKRDNLQTAVLQMKTAITNLQDVTTKMPVVMRDNEMKRVIVQLQKASLQIEKNQKYTAIDDVFKLLKRITGDVYEIKEQTVDKSEHEPKILQVTIAATVTRIIERNYQRKFIIIKNIGANDMYIGNSTVTSNTGYLLSSGNTIEFTRTKGEIHGISALGTTISYMEE